MPFCIFAVKIISGMATILLSVGVIALCIVLLGVKVFCVKVGKFPSMHIHDKPAIREKHISCYKEELDNN